MLRISRLVFGVILVCNAFIHASITLTYLGGVGNPVTNYSYNASVSAGSSVFTNDFFTLYDFQGFTGTHSEPVGWNFSSQSVGINAPFIAPGDSPLIINLTWTRSGSSVGGFGNLGTFTASSTVSSTAFEAYAAQDHQFQPQQQQFSLSGNGALVTGPVGDGSSAASPILPTAVVPGGFSFNTVTSGRWYDPPAASGFEYDMTGGSLFTDVLDFPGGFGQPFAVTVDGNLLGTFSPGQSVHFADYSGPLGGSLVGGQGVDHFTISGINPLADAGDPSAFPLQLGFNTATASFNMTAVPEPSLALSCAAALLLLATRPSKTRSARRS
jgi:hypothetical protein